MFQHFKLSAVLELSLLVRIAITVAPGNRRAAAFDVIERFENCSIRVPSVP
jgi:hypothetical protein